MVWVIERWFDLPQKKFKKASFYLLNWLENCIALHTKPSLDFTFQIVFDHSSLLSLSETDFFIWQVKI